MVQEIFTSMAARYVEMSTDGITVIIDPDTNERGLLVTPECTQEHFEVVTMNDDFLVIFVNGETDLYVPPHFKRFENLRDIMFIGKMLYLPENLGPGVKVTGAAVKLGDADEVSQFAQILALPKKLISISKETLGKVLDMALGITLFLALELDFDPGNYIQRH